MSEKNGFLPQKINEALLIGSIFPIPFGIFSLFMLYWLFDSETPQEVVYLMTFIISVFTFLIPLCLHIFRKKFWLKNIHTCLRKKIINIERVRN
ncbi:hypothetical protein MOC70_15960 [Bacillus vallismortis]|uniref:hypothetical protein n=1 Tax=Bacillus vallismortis TaxID=72361 RepID=UPI00227DFA51|nr:hypothetical protein [Bacillus vallismortis]MCY8426084.1 hypothetical protein [Bacillus vallismortis]